jgi:hypothetical protein
MQKENEQYILVRAPKKTGDEISCVVGGNQSVASRVSSSSRPSDGAPCPVRPLASGITDTKQTSLVNDISPKPPVDALRDFSERVHAAMEHLKLSKSSTKTHRSKGGGQVFRANVAIRAQVTSSANSVLNTVVHLTPNSTSNTEASSFAALFDEWRCVAMSVKARCFDTALTIGATSATGWGMVYDPANSGAYSFLVGMMLAKVHHAPIAFNRGDGATQVLNGSGFEKLAIKVPRGAFAPTSLSPPDVGVDWVSCSDTASGVGYLKFFVDAFGSGASSEIDYFIVYHNEYRMRT